MHDIIWAPWRQAYIEQVVQATGGRKKCFLCAHARTRDLAGHYVLSRDRDCLTTMNLFPYNSGHLLIAPIRHVADLSKLSTREQQALLKHLGVAMAALKKSLRPHGFNVGLNLGRAAGAGVADHIHLHVVPRWNGDTNFMPALSHCKVMPESLNDTYRKIKKHM